MDDRGPFHGPQIARNAPLAAPETESEPRQRLRHVPSPLFGVGSIRFASSFSTPSALR